MPFVGYKEIVKKIVVVSGIQIINNPRVVKEATLLASAGYDVEVIGAIFDRVSKERIQSILDSVTWRHTPVIDLTGNRLIPRMIYYFSRIRRRISFAQKRWFNIESPNQLGYFVKRLLRISERCNADLYIVHLEQALWVGKKLLEQGRNVAIDVEDWYSEDCLPEDRAFRPINLLAQCESYLLNKAIYATTTSKSLSSALQRAYQCPLPKVVYNSFPAEEKNQVDGVFLDRKNLNVPSIIWFSQTIGPGRGLEQLISALNEVNCSFELHLRGTDNRGYSRILLERASQKLRNQIFIHPQVPQAELLSRLCEHDIGYCGDLSNCRSRDLTITNKMMEYLRGGLAVVATDTSGHKEIKCLAKNAISIFQQNNTASLVLSLTRLLIDNNELLKAKWSSCDIFENKLDWEKTSMILNRLVNSCF